MKLYNVKLLTITCEILAHEIIHEFLKKNEAWTLLTRGFIWAGR